MCKTLIAIFIFVLFLLTVNHYIDKFRYTDFNDYRIVEDEFGFHIEYAEWVYGTKHYIKDKDSDGGVYSLSTYEAIFNYWQDFLIEE
jgi:hypothetical protein